MVSSVDTSVGTERKVITNCRSKVPRPARAPSRRRERRTDPGFPIYIDRAEGAILVDVTAIKSWTSARASP